jgi:signal transduction histidine kinase
MPHPKETPDRDSTDQSLGVERDKADAELAQRPATIEDDANEVVHRARSRADDVLRTARKLADRDSDAGDVVAAERDYQDDTLRGERDAEDVAVAVERDTRKRQLADLLKVEREHTDVHLMTERARSDDAIATRETFMAMVSHDLRTLLNGIALTTAMLVKESAENEAVRARAETIQRFTTRMNRLLGDLVDVAAVESGRLLITPERRELLRLMREANEAFRPVAAARGITLTSEIIGHPTTATFDHERILQVLANIIGNAIKFTPEGGRIAMTVAATDEAVLFRITDTGTGIAAENLTTVFERFWQVGTIDRRGLGLGLYISKCIVEAHGGRIWAKSEIGQGTTIFFTLPHAEKTARSTPQR